MNIKTVLKLFLSILLPLSIGAITGIFTARSIPTWYSTLNQPSFNPPNWVFGPVWTLLYIVLGTSFFLIWKAPQSRARSVAIIAFSAQMVLNFGWSFLFFYFNRIDLALAEIVLLWISILLMMVQFYRINPLSTYLNIPYLLWVTFASALNLAYYILN